MNNKTRVHVACSAAVLVAMLTMSACAPSGSHAHSAGGGAVQPRDGGTITIGIAEPFSGWDLDKLTTTTDYEVVKEVLEPLLVMSPDGSNVQTALADSYVYDAARTKLTFKLSPKATFSDGTPVTSADVAFSVEQWKKSPSGALYSSIVAVSDDDPTQAVMQLAKPDSSLLPMLTWASSAVVKKNFGGKSRAAYYAAPIGTGPYTAGPVSAGVSITLNKNPRYHRAGSPHLDSVVFKIIDDPNQRVLQFNSGEIDVYDRAAPDLAAQLPKDRVVSVPGGDIAGITFNVKKPGPTSNVDFRKAVSLAIDRQALVDSVYGGQAKVATSVLPPQVPGWVSCTKCDYAKQDKDGARQALAASGYGGQDVELTVDSSNGTEVLAAQAIQPMLKEVGINVTVKMQDLATVIARASAGEISMGMASYKSTSPTLNDALSFWYSTGGLYTQSDPEPFLSAFQAVSAAADPPQMQAAAASFEEAAFATKWMAPIANVNIIFGIAPRVKGLTVNPLTIYNLSEIFVTS